MLFIRSTHWHTNIQYETSFAGETREQYHCVLESKSFLEKMTVLEHTIPFFLPIREVENELLSSNAMKFIDHIGDLLQAYVDRREQVRLVNDLYGNQIGERYHSLPYHMIEFVVDDFNCRVTVSLRYADLLSILPTRISVVAWPLNRSNKSPSRSKKGNVSLASITSSVRLLHAEAALRTLSLPEGYFFVEVTIVKGTVTRPNHHLRLGSILLSGSNFKQLKKEMGRKSPKVYI